MILILAPPDDQHAAAVREHLTRPFATFELAAATRTAAMTAAIDGDAAALRLKTPDGDVDLAEVRSIWRRRFGAWRVRDEITDPVARRFAWSEGNEAATGLLGSAPARWINPEAADAAAGLKIVQLQRASALGLDIPATLVTNEPDRARAFIDEHGTGKTIRKAFRALADSARPTHIVTPDDFAKIADVELAPVILQEYIDADADLRVTVIGDDLFTAVIRPQPEDAVDFRPGFGRADVEAGELPDAVAEALLALCRGFGLVYAAIDVRRTPDGRHVFLEVNPAGEFLFASRRTGQPVAEALAALLERFDRETVG
jgi:glutathione synthase/RimK-type ligase-like ATP-grasp enzyme